jgi:predicted ATPase/DNA-binding CsgD family transcriptional regulator
VNTVSAVSVPNNLPAQLSSFVGRERQLAELRRQLRKSRVITLTGPGGAGKTRLALRLAGDALDRYPDGVWHVDLAPLNDVRLIEHTVASACGVKEERRRPMLEVIIEHLGAHRTLLVLDSCEHLVDPCAALVENLLRSCPKMTVLVTSREPLGVPGELIWRTPSLSLPKGDASPVEVVLESEAVRLFVERARLSKTDFDLGADAVAVAQICERLEGMPLAIELAASLARVMTPQEILERLRDRFRLLTGGSRSALPRHQTLRHAVDWSYGLLSPVEKELFALLSLFAGGFDLAAAEAVVADELSDGGGVLKLLSRLVDKSLVAADLGSSRTMRYRMLDTIREYALEKLHEGGEEEARRRHARYFIDLCRRAAVQLRGRDPLPWLQRVDEEHANVRLALGWSMVEEPDDAVRLAAAMGAYWYMRRHFAEGMEWLGQALELSTPSLDARATALWSRARIRLWYAEYETAKIDAEECVELSSKLGLGVELSGALTILGLISAAKGDLDLAERYHRDSVQQARHVGDHEGVARGLNNLALYASGRGDNDGSRSLLEEALAAARITSRISTGHIMDSLGRVNLLLGDLKAARAYYLDALEIFATLEDALSLAENLDGVALVSLAEKDAGRAVRLLAAANNLRLASGAHSLPEWSKYGDAGLAEARAELGPEASDAAWQHGAEMTLQEAVRYASGAPAAPIHFDTTPLTGREAQVAGLIADGLTNGEIAGKLRIAPRTADAHVEHIRNKLGLRTRSQIAIWAHERLSKS